jgi:hypothetical protein
MSMAGLLKVLGDLHGTLATSALNSATRHSDSMFVSHYYNWHPGTTKGAFTHGASYKLKADAPDEAVDMLSKAFIVPLMEKMLSEANATYK